MSHAANEMGHGEGTLTRAAGLVTEARGDLGRLSGKLEAQVSGLQSQWAGAGGQAFFELHRAWTERQMVIVGALGELEASLASTEQDNISTDEAQSASYRSALGRLGG